MNDQTQTDQKNAAATGNAGNVGGERAPAVQGDPATTRVAQDPAAAGSVTGKTGNEQPIDTKTAHGEVRGPARDYQTQDVAETATGLNTVEGRKAQIDRTERHLERMSDENGEGHDKNQERIKRAAEDAHKNSERGPTSGKELNRNTPRIDKDGNKHWVD